MSKEVTQKRSRALQRREDIAGYCFMLPSLIFFVGLINLETIISRIINDKNVE